MTFRSAANYSILVIFDHPNVIVFLHSVQIKWHKIEVMQIGVVLAPLRESSYISGKVGDQLVAPHP